MAETLDKMASEFGNFRRTKFEDYNASLELTQTCPMDSTTFPFFIFHFFTRLSMF